MPAPSDKALQDAVLVRRGAVWHRVHVLRCWPAPFGAVIQQRKAFELRRHDRDYREGDLLLLREYDPDGRYGFGAQLTGRWCARRVTYVLRDHSEFGGLDAGFSILSLAPCDSDGIEAAKEAGARG